MARVTVEDCMDKVENQFELVVIASHRARQLGIGSAALVDRGSDKDPVIALREIADDKITAADLIEKVVLSNRNHRVLDAQEDDFDHLLMPSATSKSIEIGAYTESDTADIAPTADDDAELSEESLEATLMAALLASEK